MTTAGTHRIGLLLCLAAACSPGRSGDASKSASAAWASRSADSLIARLVRTNGEIAPDGGFVGDSSTFVAISSLADSAGSKVDSVVAKLVACLGRADLSHVLVATKAVPVGMVCYRALSHLAYHEETDSAGAITPYWAGVVSPDASPDQLKAAQTAWERVVTERAYHIL
jgi:hypothetical protein